MSISIEKLKKGKTYACGEPFVYIFQVEQDAKTTILYRLWEPKDKHSTTSAYYKKSSSSHNVIACDKQNYIREATKEEEDYLNQCIEAGEYIKLEELKPNLSYQIY